MRSLQKEIFAVKILTMKTKHTLRFTTLFCLLLIIFGGASPLLCAEPEQQPFNFDKTQARIKEISRRLKSKDLSQQYLEKVKQETELFSRSAAACIDTTTNHISRLEQEIASLGPVDEHDSAELVKERKNLQKQKQALLVSLSECRLATTLTTRLENEMSDQNKLLLAASFFARSPGFWERTTTTLPTAETLGGRLREYLAAQSGIGALSSLHAIILALLFGGGSFIGFRLFRLLQQRLNEPSRADRYGILTLPLALATFLCGSYLLHINEKVQAPFVPWLLFSVSLYCLALLLLPVHRRLQETADGDKAVTNIRRQRFNILALFAVLLFFSIHLELDEYEALAEVQLLVQSVLIGGTCLLGGWFLWPIRLPEHLSRFENPRRGGIIALSLAVIAIELSGYRNLSLFILVGLLGTFLLGSLLRLSLFFIDQTIGGFFSGRYHWQRGLRHKLGLVPGDHLTGITWIRLIFKLLAWSIGFFLFIQLWGLPDAQTAKIHSSLTDGVGIGGLVIAPARIVFGLFVFACGWTFFSWVKMQLDRRWLQDAGFSPSAQETLVTMTGYCGFALAIIVGLSVAGFSFSNLAVIAGALSVGIGFGMQNIVNNFVSGLIILFERPVKRGDWISIGKTEGYVQKISVRSTLIQTFDRSDVIVPNSELISNQVTNMMLNDNFGRLIVPIGVAYGSDTDLVRTLLLEIAAANKEIINDGSAPKPLVLFLAFGDNALSFELRCHLANIDKRLLVKSAINYEIDRVFRLHKISMPFPQRDLYIKEFPNLNSSTAAPTQEEGKKRQQEKAPADDEA